MRIKVYHINALFLFILIIWQAFKLTYFGGIDGAGRLTIALAFLTFLANIFVNTKNIRNLFSIKSKVFFWYMIWFVYATINTVFLYSGEVPLFFFVSTALFVPFVIVLSIASLNTMYMDRLLVVIQYALLIAVILFYINSNIADTGRLSLVRFNINEMVLYPVALLTLLFIRYSKNNLKLLPFVLFSILPFVFIILSGSRMAFGMLVILITGLLFLNIDFSSTKKISIALLFLVGGIFATNYILNQTVLGERIHEVEDYTSKVPEVQGTIFEKMGDRGNYFVLGWQVFLENPIWGIGLKNFINYYYQNLHNEYMINLAELGVIGFILYAIFNMIILIKLKNKTNKMFLFAHLSILFAATSLFLYHQFPIAILYGVLLLYIKESTSLIKNNSIQT